MSLELTDLAGHDPAGTSVANFAPQSGRVAIVDEEPLLECVHGTNSEPLLILYGKPASGYAMDTRTNLAEGSWQTVLTDLTVGTNLWLSISAPASSSPENFYRASRAGTP